MEAIKHINRILDFFVGGGGRVVWKEWPWRLLTVIANYFCFSCWIRSGLILAIYLLIHMLVASHQWRSLFIPITDFSYYHEIIGPFLLVISLHCKYTLMFNFWKKKSVEVLYVLAFLLYAVVDHGVCAALRCLYGPGVRCTQIWGWSSAGKQLDTCVFSSYKVNVLA